MRVDFRFNFWKTIIPLPLVAIGLALLIPNVEWRVWVGIMFIWLSSAVQIQTSEDE